MRFALARVWPLRVVRMQCGFRALQCGTETLHTAVDFARIEDSLRRSVVDDRWRCRDVIRVRVRVRDGDARRRRRRDAGPLAAGCRFSDSKRNNNVHRIMGETVDTRNDAGAGRVVGVVVKGELDGSRLGASVEEVVGLQAVEEDVDAVARGVGGRVGRDVEDDVVAVNVVGEKRDADVDERLVGKVCDVGAGGVDVLGGGVGVHVACRLGEEKVRRRRRTRHL